MKARPLLFLFSAMTALLITTGVTRPQPVLHNLVKPAVVLQALTPPYLNQFPTVESIKSDVRGVDAMETAAKQAGIFWLLRQLIYDLALSQRRTDRQFTPDEQRLEVEYRNAHYKAIEPFEGKVTGADKSKWFELRGKYEMDRWLLDEVMKKYFTPELRRAVYVALKGQMPTENAPEESRLTPPAGSSTVGTNPRKTPDSTSSASEAGAEEVGRLYHDAEGNWKYKDRWGGIYDKHGYTWADGSLTTNSGIKVKADQPGVVDYGYGLKTDLGQFLGSPVTLQETTAYATSFEESLQLMGASQPTNALNDQQRQTAWKAAGSAVTQPPQPTDAQKRVMEAAIKYNEARVRAAKLQSSDIDRGDKYFEDEDYQRAIDAYKQALIVSRETEDKAYLNNNIGMCLIKLQRHAEAVAYFLESDRLQPNEPTINLNLAEAYFGSRKLAAAATAFKKAINLKPELAEAHYGLGSVYVVVGMKNEALDVLGKLMKLDPQMAQSLREAINKMK